MNTQRNNPHPPEQIERDIEKTRQELADTLDSLQKSLSPGQLVDQVLGYLDPQSGHLGSDIAGALRDNPVPTALAGAGLAWLAARMALARPAQSTGDTPHPDTPAATYHLGEKAFTERRLGGDRRMSGNKHGWRGHPVPAGSEMEGSTHFPIERRRNRRRADTATDTARPETQPHAGKDTEPPTGTASRYTQEAWEGTLRLTGEQPLLLGALGLAVGMLLGAGLLPATADSGQARRPQDQPPGEPTRNTQANRENTRPATPHPTPGPVSERTAGASSMHENLFFANRPYGASETQTGPGGFGTAPTS